MIPRLLLVVVGAVAWSHEPHKIVARLAGEILSRKAARYVRMRLEESIPRTTMKRAQYALVKSSTWADHMEDGTGDLHSSHTPFRDYQPFLVERDCPSDRWVVPAIGNFTKCAANATLPLEERRDARRFLAHLVAEAHNPMQVGFADDQGGNAIRVIIPGGNQTSLHTFWGSAT